MTLKGESVGHLGEMQKRCRSFAGSSPVRTGCHPRDFRRPEPAAGEYKILR